MQGLDGNASFNRMLLIIVEIRGNELGRESERERERDALSVHCVGTN